MHESPQKLSGLLVIETDDLLGGGITREYHDAKAKLRKRFNFGSWTELSERSTQYGGRTLVQKHDYSIEISMYR